MALKLSDRSQVSEFRALSILAEVAERRKQGENIINLSPGQPCFGAPAPVLRSAQTALENDPIQGYTAAVGISELRHRIAQYYKDTYDCTIDAKRIAITTSSSGGITIAMLAAFNPGDTIAITTPTYPAYRNIIKAAGLNLVEIETTSETNYQPTAELLAQSGQTFDGLIITNPSNPTGAIISAPELKKICTWCDENGIRLLSDEAYHGITYEEKAQTAALYSDSAIITNTFSKYFALTGWRLGWIVAPDDMIDSIKKMAENLFVSPPTIAQHVALECFNHLDLLDNYVAHYKRNRDILRTELPKIGMSDLSAAHGAFYFYIGVKDLTNNSEEFCRRMLDEAHVALTPGVDFDKKRGQSTLRISYAGTPEDMYEACARLKKVIG